MRSISLFTPPNPQSQPRLARRWRKGGCRLHPEWARASRSKIRTRLAIHKEVDRTTNGPFLGGLVARHSRGRNLPTAITDTALEDVDVAVAIARRGNGNLIEVAAAS